MSRTVLAQRMSRTMKKKELDEALDMLEEGAEITVHKVIPPTGGKTALFYSVK